MRFLLPFVLFSLGFCQVYITMNCNVDSVTLQVNQEMTTPIICTTTYSIVPRITPELPAGLTYSYTVENSVRTIKIYGTPIEGLNPRLFYIGYNDVVSIVEISVFATPTYCSYGFESMTLYTDIEMEPIPIQCNTAISEFYTNPILPDGMGINPTNGTIYGKLTNYNNDDVIYTVTAKNAYGSTTTTFTFRARSQQEMTTPGMIACYWKTITECRVPDFDFFYKNPAQLCQTVGDINFTDNDVDNTWPGLDRRFVDYYSAYFYSYLNILVAGEYKFYLSTDDGGFLYIDDISTPVISRESCRPRGETSNTVTLTAGRHLIVIRYFEYNSWASLYLMYESEIAGISKKVVSTDLLRVGGRGPTFVSYPFVGGYVNMDMDIFRPELASGAPVSWTIEPTLPNGISIDSGTGYIQGRPTAASSGTYTVTATGVNGVAKAEVRIVITNSPMNGIYTKYYKVTDYSNMCSYNMLTGNAIELSQVNIQSNIYYPTSTESVVWSGFPYDLGKYIYVEWYTYLKMDQIGNWRLRLTCDDGCKLFAADEQSLITHWGCHGSTSMETIYPVSKNGYYYFRVEWQQQAGSKSITFEWMAPNGYWQVVPAENMYYVPTGVISYKYERSHYFKDVQITDNQVTYFGISNAANFRITPSLPAGLTINVQNGMISGTPTATQIMTQYTVSATASGKTETTVIALEIVDLAPPSQVYYMRNGQVVNEGTPVVLTALAEMAEMTIAAVDSSSITEYSITPDLPSGLIMSTNTGRVHGTPTQAWPETMYTVSAINPAGTFELTFSLSVTGCQASDGSWTGQFVHVKNVASGTTGAYPTVSVVTATGGSQNCFANSMSSETTCTYTFTSVGDEATFCINPTLATTSKLRFICSGSSTCKWQAFLDDGYFAPRSVNTNQADDMTYPTSCTAITSLTMSSNSVETFAGFDISGLSVSLDGCYKSFTINPPMGDVTVDVNTLELTGTATGSNTQTYQITALGDSSSASQSFSVKYNTCNVASGYQYVNFVKVTTTSSERWTLMKSTTTLYDSGTLSSGVTYYKSFCLEPGDYIISMYGSSSWSSSATLNAYNDEDDLLKSFMLSTGTSGSASWKLTAPYETVDWKYYTSGKVDSNWNLPSFTPGSEWNDVTIGEAGQWSKNAAYFIHTFDLLDGNAYPVLEFGIYYKDGAIAYLNGVEVYRRNMASASNVNVNTPATSTFDDYYVRIGTASGNNFVTGKNVFAVELHRTASTSGPIYWSAYVSYTEGDCVTRSVGGTITESQFYDKTGETAAEAWDGSTSTQWTENGLPAWTTYTYNFDHVEWINRISLASNKDDETRDPTSFTVYGSDDGVTWTAIYTASDKSMFTARTQTRNFMMMDHMSSYGRYRFEISRTKSGVAQTSISKLALEACRLVYCPKDGDYPGTLSGETVTIDCADGYLGERYRTCSNDVVQPQWGEPNENECISRYPTSKGTSYIDTVFIISPMTYIDLLDLAIDPITTVLHSYLEEQVISISVWKAKDVTSTYEDSSLTDEASKTAAWVRVTVSDKVASDVLKKMAACLSTLQSQLTTYYPAVFASNTYINFYTAPELNQYKGVGAVSIGLIIILVLVVLVIAAIIAFYLWTRLKNKKTKNGAKKLRHANASKGAVATKSSV